MRNKIKVSDKTLLIKIFYSQHNVLKYLYRVMITETLHPGGLALQRHAGQTAVLQALTLGHLGSNDYLMTEIFVDNFVVVDNVD